MKPTFARSLGPDDDGRRIEKIMRKVFSDIPLSVLHKALRLGKIRVNGKRQKPDYLCQAGDKLEAFGLEASTTSRIQGTATAAALPPECIILETDDLLFINKPLGLLIHDGPASLDSMVGAYLSRMHDQSISFRPGPLHRLDRNTSGLITFSKTLRGATFFSESMREHRIRKTYIALFEGEICQPDTWEDLLWRDEAEKRTSVAEDGRRAITSIAPLYSNKGMTLASVRLLTGKTHQIRAQAQAHGHPLFGDVKYGGKPCTLPYYLHSWKLEMEASLLAGIPSVIMAPLPHYFQEFCPETEACPENAVYS